MSPARRARSSIFLSSYLRFLALSSRVLSSFIIRRWSLGVAGLVVLQQLHDAPELRAGVDIGVAPAGVVAALHERYTLRVQVRQLLPHPINVEGDVMQAIAVLVELILPCARLADRLDRLDI